MPASPYFDRTYFISTYFDVDAASSGRSPKLIVLTPEPPNLDEEFLEWIT